MIRRRKKITFRMSDKEFERFDAARLKSRYWLRTWTKFIHAALTVAAERIEVGFELTFWGDDVPIKQPCPTTPASSDQLRPTADRASDKSTSKRRTKPPAKKRTAASSSR